MASLRLGLLRLETVDCRLETESGGEVEVVEVEVVVVVVVAVRAKGGKGRRIRLVVGAELADCEPVVCEYCCAVVCVLCCAVCKEPRENNK